MELMRKSYECEADAGDVSSEGAGAEAGGIG
jgi:hypothetical protein